ncbi:hypothetical protein HKBW3S47_00352, partial [Candidatus Hakubella thermalkaliphila]
MFIFTFLEAFVKTLGLDFLLSKYLIFSWFMGDETIM